MARYFFRYFTENNTVERHSKVFFITDAKWLRQLQCVRSESFYSQFSSISLTNFSDDNQCKVDRDCSVVIACMAAVFTSVVLHEVGDGQRGAFDLNVLRLPDPYTILPPGDVGSWVTIDRAFQLDCFQLVLHYIIVLLFKDRRWSCTEETRWINIIRSGVVKTVLRLESLP